MQYIRDLIGSNKTIIVSNPYTSNAPEFENMALHYLHMIKIPMSNVEFVKRTDVPPLIKLSGGDPITYPELLRLLGMPDKPEHEPRPTQHCVDAYSGAIKQEQIVNTNTEPMVKDDDLCGSEFGKVGRTVSFDAMAQKLVGKYS